MNLGSRIDRLGLAFCTLLYLGVCGANAARGGDVDGAVYTLSNEAGGNSLLVFDRHKDGGLSFSGMVPTGGAGLGAGLASEGSVILGPGGVLYTVNAGSHNVTAFKVETKAPRAIQLIDSGGLQPISLTAREDALYVLNQGSADGGVDQITGFSIHRGTGHLTPLSGSTRSLSAGAVSPAQVSFNPVGSVLVVTEKATNNIDTFRVDSQGYAGAANVHPSSGMTPYGFAFNRSDFLIVSEAFGGVAGAGDVSSYGLNTRTGSIQVVSASVATFQTAPCWVAVTHDGRYAYSSNTGSGNVTGFRVHGNGALRAPQ